MNVAVGRPANQSLKYLDWTADKAVDGNTCRDDKDPDIDKCCSATEDWSAGVEVFWSIDLQEQYEVERLEIYARTGK